VSDPVSKGQEAPPTPSNAAGDAKTVKVTLKVTASGGDIGVVGSPGDEVEVDAATAERWVAAGIAEKSAAGGGRTRPSVPRQADEDAPPTAGPTGRRA